MFQVKRLAVRASADGMGVALPFYPVAAAAAGVLINPRDLPAIDGLAVGERLAVNPEFHVERLPDVAFGGEPGEPLGRVLIAHPDGLFESPEAPKEALDAMIDAIEFLPPRDEVN